MDSDQSAENIYHEVLEVFTGASTPSEPRTATDVAAVLDADVETVQVSLERLTDDGKLRSKPVGEAARVWWRPETEPPPQSSDVEGTTDFESLLSQSADYLMITDANGVVTYVTDPVETVLGCQPEELVGTSSFELIHPDDRAEAVEQFDALVSGADAELVDEFRVRHADGSWRWIELTGVDKRSDSSINGVLMNVREISSRKQREQAFQRRSRRLEAVLDSIESAVYMKDTDGSYLLMNQKCRALFGVSDDQEISTLTDQDLFDTATAAKFRADDRQVFETESTIAVEEEIPVAEGARTHLTRKTPLYDGGEVYALCAVSTDITEQKAREQRLKQQRTDLAALNSLNRVFREITDAVLEQSTRDEIETTLCTQLVDSESYELACLADVEPGSDTITLRASAGDVAAFDSETTTSPIETAGQDLIEPTFRNGDLTIIEAIAADSAFGAPGQRLAANGIELFAAVPISYESTQYGVLGIFTERDDAFGAYEQAVFRQLGEVVGHAIAASERQRALLSNESIELSFEVDAAFDRSEVPVDTGGVITYDRAVPVGDGGFLVYGTATSDAMELIEGLVETDEFPRWESVTLLDTGDEPRFELTFSDHPVFSTVTAQAGYIHEATVEEGTIYMTLHFAPNADIQQAIDGIKTAYPEATLTTRSRTVRPDELLKRPAELLATQLTERQLAALEAAYGAGFFNWPRDSSGEAVADSLGISPSTFHQHLRKAQQALTEMVFETDPER